MNDQYYTIRNRRGQFWTKGFKQSGKWELAISDKALFPPRAAKYHKEQLRSIFPGMTTRVEKYVEPKTNLPGLNKVTFSIKLDIANSSSPEFEVSLENIQESDESFSYDLRLKDKSEEKALKEGLLLGLPIKFKIKEHE